MKFYEKLDIFKKFNNMEERILWRINFILIKFLLNKLLSEKLRNEYKKPSFRHKAMCI